MDNRGRREGDSPRSLAEVEAALRESEERYALVQQGSNDGIWDWNIATGKVFFSDRWKAILGYAPDEISENVEEWKTRIHPEDLDRVMAVHREHFEGKTPYFEVEYRLRHKDGSYRWILGRGACLRNAKGVPVRTAGSHVDITRRKEAAERLRRSEERMKAILSALPDLIFRIDRDGTFLDFHTPSPGLLALPPEQFLGRCLADVMPPEIAQKSLHHVEETLREGGISPSLEYRLSIGGRMADFEARFARSGPDEVVAIVRDITEKKQAEEAIRRSEGHLLQVRKFEAIGRLTGGMAHHLNNLMTVVTGYCELLLTRIPAADPLRANIEKVCRAGERAADLTRELLAFSRRQILQPQTVEINLFLSSLSAALQDLAGPSVRVLFLPGKDAGVIRVDPNHLRRTLTQLIANARDAMPGGGKIRLATEGGERIEPIEGIESPPGQFVLLAVQDNGCGMDAETRDRIFEPFHSLKTGSEGLGLPSVYGFVKQSGGYIFVDSSPGRGTTFRIYFPSAAGSGEPDPRGESPLAGHPDAG
jgi:two-component system, cell cycle sensor histidine kinase and response regulator CckA